LKYGCRKETRITQKINAAEKNFTRQAFLPSGKSEKGKVQD